MIQEKIVETLKNKSGYISGEEMSTRLKVSRQALWKHIQELRDLGYDIVAVPHLGYQLVSLPDKLLASEINCGLNTKFLGKKIHYFESVPSTMDLAIQLGLQGSGEGTLVVAEAQTKGRGRLGRSWISPKHKGIYLSLILKPKILPAQSPVITLLVSISICEAIKEVTGLDARIKWPNDIFIQNKKVGGILTELSAEMDQIHFMVIGIGLNVNNDKNSLPAHAASLKEIKKENTNRVILVQEILRRIEQDYLAFQKQGSLPVVNKWRNYNITLGRRVKVASCSQHLEGEAIDIDTDGGLLIRNDAGLVQKIMAGDVVNCR